MGRSTTCQLTWLLTWQVGAQLLGVLESCVPTTHSTASSPRTCCFQELLTTELSPSHPKSSGKVLWRLSWNTSCFCLRGSSLLWSHPARRNHRGTHLGLQKNGSHSCWGMCQTETPAQQFPQIIRGCKIVWASCGFPDNPSILPPV